MTCLRKDEGDAMVTFHPSQETQGDSKGLTSKPRSKGKCLLLGDISLPPFVVWI